jgi:hypothetical protein
VAGIAMAPVVDVEMATRYVLEEDLIPREATPLETVYVHVNPFTVAVSATDCGAKQNAKASMASFTKLFNVFMDGSPVSGWVGFPGSQDSCILPHPFSPGNINCARAAGGLTRFCGRNRKLAPWRGGFSGQGRSERLTQDGR